MNPHKFINGTQVLETDVLIVGSGPIGATYARKITDASKDIKVLMVDIGQQGTRLIGDHKKNNIVTQKEISRFTSSIQGGWSLLSKTANPARNNTDHNSLLALSNHLNSPEFILNDNNSAQSPYDNLPAAPVVREVGGMANYWTCCTPKQHPELERSNIFSDEEWRDLYNEASVLFRTTSSAFDHSIRQKLVKDTLIEANPGRKFIGMPLACQRSTCNPDYVEWTATAHILADLADPKYNGGNFELRAQHLCTKLHIDSTGRNVTSAELKNLLTNEVLLVKAKKYAICGGAILGAGVLFNSGIRPDMGYPAFGRYMTEQIVAFCQVVLKRSLIESLRENPSCKEHARRYPQDPLRIPFNDPDPQITSPLSKEYPWHTQIHRDAYGYGSVPTSVDQRLVIDLRFFGYVKPLWSNRVEFSTEIFDTFGMPQPTFHYRIGEEDAERAQAMMKDMVKVASDLGSFLPGGEPKYLPPGAALHICGTTRAGNEDDGSSVVDRHSKVWRVHDLFVGGAGVIPTQNACNPTLTAACFAIVAAKEIVKEICELKAKETKENVARL